jgi:hypothetical protein
VEVVLARRQHAHQRAVAELLEADGAAVHRRRGIGIGRAKDVGSTATSSGPRPSGGTGPGRAASPLPAVARLASAFAPCRRVRKTELKGRRL